MMEPSVAPGAATWEPMYREFDRDWKTVHDYRTVRQVLLMIIINVASNILLYLIVSALSSHNRYDQVHVSMHHCVPQTLQLIFLCIFIDVY
jgi:hypothetical protein